MKKKKIQSRGTRKALSLGDFKKKREKWPRKTANKRMGVGDGGSSEN